jgi:NADH-quinone oxidoreductase subunit K
MNYVILASILFSVGATAVLLRRNAIIAFMGIELMLNASNLLLVTFARVNGVIAGQVDAFAVLVVAAAEVVVGLAIIIALSRSRQNISLDEPSEMKG